MPLHLRKRFHFLIAPLRKALDWLRYHWSYVQEHDDQDSPFSDAPPPTQPTQPLPPVSLSAKAEQMRQKAQMPTGVSKIDLKETDVVLAGSLADRARKAAKLAGRG